MELEKLLSSLHDGLAEEAEVRRIEELLSGDPETCEFYLDYTQMVATTELEVVAPQPLDVGAKTVPLAIAQSTALFFEGQNTRQILNPSWKPLPWFGVAAAILLFAGSLALFFGKKNPMSPTEAMAEEVTQNGVAVLMESVRAKFGDGLVPDPVNGMLPPGELHLEAGIAEIEFLNGARILLDGPAVFQITSENGGSLRDGRLRARVPEQVDDFSIVAPQVEVADRGAEFAVSVGIEDGRKVTEVHCFNGEVDVYNAGVLQSQANPRPWHTLSAMEALRVWSNGESKPPAVPYKFRSFEAMAAEALQKADQRYNSWRDYIAELRRADGDIVALYSFDEQEPSERTLVNQAPRKAAIYPDQFSHGAIVGCRWTSGRWPSKGALAFARPADRVNIKGDKSYRSLTLATWVRIDGLTRPNVLLSSAQADLGAVQWSIKGDGGLAFQLRGKDPEKKTASKVYRFQTEPGKTEIGGWHHLAMVYDGEQGKVSHFIDGKLVSENKVSKPAKVPVVLGDAQIGNASESNSSGQPLARHTNGRIDEFAIFGRAMGADEIAHMASFGPQG